MWAAIGQTGSFGPYFFDENVTSERCFTMLQEQFWPDVIGKGDEDTLIFMQNGAPPHWGRNVRAWFNETLPGRWMGRGSPNLPWPPRSPDLTPCDFFLWGFIKSKVYATQSPCINTLKQRIRAAFIEIAVDIRNKLVLACREKLNLLVENSGSHIEVHC